jgi:hypothetical protein
MPRAAGETGVRAGSSPCRAIRANSGDPRPPGGGPAVVGAPPSAALIPARRHARPGRRRPGGAGRVAPRACCARRSTPWARSPVSLDGGRQLRRGTTAALASPPARPGRKPAVWGARWAAPRGRVVSALERAREVPARGRSPRVHPSAARGRWPAMLWGHPPPREPPCRPGRAAPGWALGSGADRTPWRGAVPSRLEAAALARDCRPGEGWPGRHPGLALRWVGAWPLTHPWTVPGPGPTAASPGQAPGPWLLRASASPAAWGWRRRRQVPAAQRAAGGDAVPRAQGGPPSGGALHRGARPGTPGRASGCRRLRLCPVGASASAAGAGSPHEGWAPRRWRDPSMLARRDPQREAARVRR